MTKKILYSIGLTVAVLAFLVSLIMLQVHRIRDAVPVSLPMFTLNTDDLLWNKLGYVSAKGTWTFVAPDVIGGPFRTSDIVCDKRQGECRESTASLFEFGSGTPFLTASLENYQILKWDNSQIIYTENKAECVYYIYTINRITKEVSGVRRPKPNADQKLCENIEKKEMQLRLVDGLEVVRSETAKVDSSVFAWASLISAGLLWLLGLYFIWKKSNA
jgi:hypothetical protein